MDIDRYIAENEPAWARLSFLTARARTGLRKMPSHEIDELVSLYQKSSSQLSFARGEFRDVALNSQLTMLVAEARVVIYGTKARGARSLVQFFSVRFPAAVWHCRRVVVIAALITFLPALALGTWISFSDRALDAAAPEAVRAAYVADQFEDYYSSQPAAEFSTKVLVNNIYVSFLAFASGILLCVPTALILAFNGANVGLAAGLFHAAGEAPRFWGLILPPWAARTLSRCHRRCGRTSTWMVGNRARRSHQE